MKKATKATRSVGRPVGKSGVNKTKLIEESFGRGFTKPREICADIKKRSGVVVGPAYVGVIKAHKSLVKTKKTKDSMELAAAKYVFSLGGSFKDAVAMLKDLEHMPEVDLVLKFGSVEKALSVVQGLAKKAK